MFDVTIPSAFLTPLEFAEVIECIANRGMNQHHDPDAVVLKLLNEVDALRTMMNQLGFCYRHGESLPCECGKGF